MRPGRRTSHAACVVQLALDRCADVRDGCSRGRPSTRRRSPSISSRPSASTMRQPCVRSDRQRRRAVFIWRIRQPDVIEPLPVPVGQRSCVILNCHFAPFMWRSLSPLPDAVANDRRRKFRPMPTDALARRFAQGQARRTRPPSLRRSLRDTTRDGRHLGRAQRPAAAVVLLQRLPQPHPPSGGQAGRDRGDPHLWRRRRRLAAGHRQSSAATPNWKPAWRASKGTEAACVFGSGYLANAGIIPVLIGAARISSSSTNCRMPASGPAHNCRAANVMTFRHSDVEHAEALLAEQPRPSLPCADRHRRRVLDGWRPRATRRTVGAGAARTTPG